MDATNKFVIATLVAILFVGMPLYLPKALKSSEDNTFFKSLIAALCLIGVGIEWLIIMYGTLAFVWEL